MGGRRADDVSWPLIEQRLTALEKRVDGGFKDLTSQIAGLAFVRSDVYAAEQVTLRQTIEAVLERSDQAIAVERAAREQALVAETAARQEADRQLQADVASNRRVAMWSLYTIAGALLAAIVLAIIRAAVAV